MHRIHLLCALGVLVLGLVIVLTAPVLGELTALATSVGPSVTSGSGADQRNDASNSPASTVHRSTPSGLTSSTESGAEAEAAATVPVPTLGFSGLLLFLTVLTTTGVWVLRADDR